MHRCRKFRVVDIGTLGNEYASMGHTEEFLLAHCFVGVFLQPVYTSIYIYEGRSKLLILLQLKNGRHRF